MSRSIVGAQIAMTVEAESIQGFVNATNRLLAQVMVMEDDKGNPVDPESIKVSVSSVIYDILTPSGTIGQKIAHYGTVFFVFVQDNDVRPRSNPTQSPSLPQATPIGLGMTEGGTR